MRRKVYRSLDRPVIFFVFKGRFTGYFLLGTAVSVAAGLLVGRIIAGYIGVMVFAALFVADIYLVLSIQARMSEREFSRQIVSKRLPSCIRVSASDLKMVERFRQGIL